MAERTLGPNHPSIAEFLRRLGFAEFSRRRLTEARRLRERAVRVGEAALAPCDPAVTRLLNGLAESMQLRRRLLRSRRLYGRALTTIERCLGTLHSDYATYIFNDASLAREIGDLAEADALYDRALQIWTNGLGPDHASSRAVSTRLPKWRRCADSSDRSRELYERALAIHRRQLGPNHPQVAWMLTNLARTVADEGNTRRSACATSIRRSRIFQEVRIVRRARSPRSRARAARHVADARGQPGRARASLAQALAAARAHFRPRPPARRGDSRDAGGRGLALGQRDAALTAALDAEQTGRDHLRFTVRYLPERQAMAYAAKRPRGLDLALSVTAAAVPG